MLLILTFAALLASTTAMPAVTARQPGSILSTFDSTRHHQYLKRDSDHVAHAASHLFEKRGHIHPLRGVGFARPNPASTTKPTRGSRDEDGPLYTFIPNSTTGTTHAVLSEPTTCSTTTITSTYTVTCTSTVVSTSITDATAGTNTTSATSSTTSSISFSTSTSPISTTSSSPGVSSCTATPPAPGSLGNGTSILGHINNQCPETVYVHTSIGDNPDQNAFDDPLDPICTYPIAPGATYTTGIRAVENGTGGVSVKLGRNAVMDPNDVYQVEYSQAISFGVPTIWYDLSSVNGDPFLNVSRWLETSESPPTNLQSPQACSKLINTPGSSAADWPVQISCSPVADIHFQLCQ